MPRKISPKILYLEIDEEVTSIIDRIKETRNKHILLVIPIRSIVLQSIVNLKLIKKQSEKLDKQVSLVTTDKTGRNLASQVGLTVYSSLEEKGDVGEEREGGGGEIERYREREGEGGERESREKKNILSKSKELRKKLGLSDQKNDEQKEEKKERPENIKPLAKKTAPIQYKTKEIDDIKTIKRLSPNKRFLYFLSTMGVIVFSIVGYFVLPDATLEIRPKFEPVSYPTNITLLDVNRYANLLNDQNRVNLVSAYQIEVREHTLSEQAPVNGVRSIGGKSEGTITVRSKSSRSWKFVKNTRFQSPDGFIFRSVDAVNVPGNGKVNIRVIADDVDIKGESIGTRGNIEPTTFTIPGLGNLSPQFVDGVSNAAFTGGTDEIEKVVTRGDIEAAKEFVLDKVFEVSEKTIIDTIEKVNKEKNLNLRFFKTGNNDTDVYTEVLDIIVDTGLIDQSLESFPIAAKVRMNGWAYDANQMLGIMKEGLQSSILDNREIVEIDEDNLELRVLENLPGEQRIKVETTIRGVSKYTLDDRFKERIKKQILGKSPKETEEILKNFPEIGEIKLTLWPWWVRNIPGVKSNITVIELDG